jgi:hypothetical protein
MRAEFFAIRTEMGGEFVAVRTEMRGEFSAVRAEMAEQGVSLATQMRVLHEDGIGRIALLQEGLSGGPKRRPKRKWRRFRRAVQCDRCRSLSVSRSGRPKQPRLQNSLPKAAICSMSSCFSQIREPRSSIHRMFVKS